VPQASKDLAQYQELLPDNLRYDRSEKRYFATTSFRPRFLKPDADHFLAQLQFAADPALHGDRTWLASPPSIDTMPVPSRRVDIAVLRMILAAVRGQASVEVLYQSMNERRPEPLWRRISPHAFGSDGFRWHIRAYCHIDRKFKDFLLSRCLQARSLEESAAQPEDDKHWANFFDVKLSPNPRIGENQQR